MSPSIVKSKYPQVFGSLTDIGNVRGHNEDSFAVQAPLFVVADGMGGHEAGEVASSIAIQTMLDNIPIGPHADELAEAVRKANLAVLRGAADGTGKPGMGTTMTAALVFGDEVVIAQVGDSRAYLLHDGALQRITRDHSLVADYVAQGRITEAEARYHPQRSVITRALGSDPDMEPDLYSLRVEEGDRLLLCSDGLTSMVEDDGIAAILADHSDPQRCCSALVQEALAAGGLDNVTVVVVDPLRKPNDEGLAISAEKASANKRAIRRAPIVWGAVFCVVIAAVCIGIGVYVNNSYFLKSDDGHVSVYKGLPGSIAGIRLSWLERATDIPVDQLAPSTASRLEEGVTVENLDAALSLVDTYEQTVALAQGAEGTNSKSSKSSKKDSGSSAEPDSSGN